MLRNRSHSLPVAESRCHLLSGEVDSSDSGSAEGTAGVPRCPGPLAGAAGAVGRAATVNLNDSDRRSLSPSRSESRMQAGLWPQFGNSALDRDRPEHRASDWQ